MRFENLEEPRLLLEAASRGSLTAAAKALEVTPAAASATLKKMEARMGVRLFERSTRSMRLTMEGAALLGYCQRALALLDEGTALISEGSRGLRGALRVTAPSDLTRRILLPMLDDFLDANPEIDLMLAVSDSVHDLIRDQVDVAIRYGEPADSGLVARLLAPARRAVVASPAYLAQHGTPLHPSDLANHECLVYLRNGRPHNAWRFAPAQGDVAGSIEVRVSGRRTTDDAELTQRWAIEGRGIAYKSELDIDAAVSRGELVRVLADWLGEATPLNAMLPSNRFVPARVKALVAHLQAGFDGAPTSPGSTRTRTRAAGSNP